MPKGGASLHGSGAVCKRVLRVLHPWWKSMRVLTFSIGMVTALFMRVLDIVGTMVLVKLAGAVWAVKAVAFTGTEAECSQESE